jgi:putative nucleotidyltransferase with HDIG domain
MQSSTKFQEKGIDAMNVDAVKAFLVKGSDLPTLPEVALLAMHKIQDPESSAVDIVRIIERDPAMSAKVLSVANSAYYGMSRRVDSLNMAVVILGMRQCATLVMGMSVFKGFSNNFANDLEYYYDLWRHLIASAEVSSILADRFRLRDPAMVYTGGLLHDLGKVIICMKYPDKYHAMIRLCQEKELSLSELEKREFKVSHDVIGGCVVAQWNFPPSLVNIISNHHSLNGDLDSISEVAAISLADSFCRQESIGTSGNYESADFLTDNAWAPLFSQGWGKNLTERKDIQHLLIDQKQRITEMTEEFLEICTA